MAINSWRPGKPRYEPLRHWDGIREAEQRAWAVRTRASMALLSFGMLLIIASPLFGRFFSLTPTETKSSPKAAADSSGTRIRSWSAHIVFRSDERVSVIETLSCKVVAPAAKGASRGPSAVSDMWAIMRELPKEVYDSKDGRHELNYSGIRVAIGEQPAFEPSVEDVGHYKKIYAGRPGEYLRPGEHTFTIMYDIEGAPYESGGYNEFRWVAIPPAPLSIRSATVSLELPERIGIGNMAAKSVFVLRGKKGEALERTITPVSPVRIMSPEEAEIFVDLPRRETKATGTAAFVGGEGTRADPVVITARGEAGSLDALQPKEALGFYLRWRNDAVPPRQGLSIPD